MKLRAPRPWRWLWPAPWSLFGLLWATLMWLSGGQLRRVGPTIEASGGWLAALPWPMVAITFGHVILARDAQVLALWRRHERVHVRQYERWGPAFVPAYLIESAWQALRGRHPWRDNRFERAAGIPDSPAGGAVRSTRSAPARASDW
jgi:hypothetical protein